MKKYIQPQSCVVRISVCQLIASSPIQEGLSQNIGVNNNITTTPGQALSDDIDIIGNEDWCE